LGAGGGGLAQVEGPGSTPGLSIDLE
jgi:hypothetical protein